MKKISVVLALLMMMGFAGVASSANLSFGAVPLPVSNGGSPGSFESDTSGNTIAGGFGFGHVGNVIPPVSFSHDWNFTSSDASAPVLASLSELPHEKIDITNITFDGVKMGFDMVNQRWFGNGALSFAHILHVGGTVSASEGTQYILNISTPSNVPVPAALWLFGSAILGLLGVSNRKKGLKALIS